MVVDERACDQHCSKQSARDPRVSKTLLASDVLHGTLNKKPVDLQGTSQRSRGVNRCCGVLGMVFGSFGWSSIVFLSVSDALFIEF